MEESLSVIAEVISEYQAAEALTVNKLTIMLRRLCTHDFHLANHDNYYHKKHTETMYNHEGSVASGRVKADHDVPELRHIRKIRGAVDNVMWSMRSELSILKSENKN